MTAHLTGCGTAESYVQAWTLLATGQSEHPGCMRPPHDAAEKGCD